MENGHKGLTYKVSPFVFWGYNIVYFIFVILILLNISSGFFGRDVSLIEILTFGGSFPTNLLVMIYGFLLTPFVAMALGYFTKLKREPQNLIKLFFGFEIPLMGLMLIRIIFLREVTPVVWLFFFGVFLSVVGLLVHLFHPNIRSKTKLTSLMLSQQIALLVASYAFLLAFFFLPIVIAFFVNMLGRVGIGNFIQGLFNTLSYGGLLLFLLYLFFTLIFLLTASFFTIGPIGAFITFWTNCKHHYKKLVGEYGLNYSRLTRYGVSALYVIIILLLSVQVNANRYTNLINAYKNAPTFEEKQQIAKEIINRENEIKNGLTSSYLAQYRYLSDEKMNLLQQGYKNELGADDSTAQSIQGLFNNIALPFIYRGAFEEDIKQSSENYRELFDNSIQKGELDTISKTLQSTNTQDSLKAGILDLNKKTVKLVSRVVKVTPQNEGLLATVTIEEEYENTSSRDPQEVYYEFSLPDNAVITELKLGPDLEIGANAADKPVPSASTQSPTNQSTTQPTKAPEKVDTAVVAPQGAANTTYEAQIFRRSDPALLAQVGPRQYKLRIFPIPAKGWTLEGRPTTLPQKNQKVRYSYVTLVDPQGVPLPSVVEQRNVFTDRSTKITHSIAGKDSLVPPSRTENLRFIKLPQPLPCLTNAFEFQTAMGRLLFVPHRSNPALSSYYSCQNGFAQADKTISGLRIALLLDTSYSNSQKDWDKYLRENFPVSSLVRNNTVDLYYFNDKVSQRTVLTEEVLNDGLNVINLGKTDRVGALAFIPGDYNLILVVTDNSVFDAKSEGRTILSRSPIYLIQPEGQIPPYNEILSNAVIQSKGKIVDSGNDAIAHYWQLRQTQSLEQMGTILDTNDLGTWILLNKGNTTAFTNLSTQSVDSQSPLGLLAQKRIILESIREAGQSLTSLEVLDRIHQLSQQSFIVTPYSSMIVLVTEEQKRQLAEVSKQNNRYQLALDTGEEQLGDPSGRGILQIGAVPEPHEWLLIITGFFLLAYFYRGRIIVVLQPVYESYRRKIKHS